MSADFVTAADIERHLAQLREQLAQLQGGGITSKPAMAGLMVDTTAESIQRLQGYIRTFEILLAERRREEC